MPRVPVLIVAVFFFSLGISRFLFADFFDGAMPTYLPFHLELVYLSGLLEMMGAIGMLFAATRLYAAYGLITLSVAAMPASLLMAVNQHTLGEVPALFLYLRLPLQIAIIAFVWWTVSHERDSRNETAPEVRSLANTRLEGFCREFVSSFSNLLQWKWDDRYQVALAEFGIEHEERVLGILEKYLKSLWDTSSINAAPQSIKSVVEEMGGLKSGQLLFTSDSIDGTFIYCMLWPWGNQKTISIRISPWYNPGTEEEKQAQISQVKEWFNIQPEQGWVKMESNIIKAG